MSTPPVPEYTPPPPSVITTVIQLTGGSYSTKLETSYPTLATSVAGGAPQSVWLKIGTKTVGGKAVNSPSPTPGQPPGQTPAKSTDIPINNNGQATPVGQPTPGVQSTASIIQPATFIPLLTTIIDSVGKPVVTTVPVALDSAGSILNIASGLISADATTTFLLKPSASATPGSSIGADDNSGAVLHYFTMRDYVTGAFLPTILAVLFAIPWTLIDTAAKQIEPIYQLAEIRGASAANSLSLNYVTMSMFVVPFRAFSRRHWVIALTSILMLLSLVTPPLAVESIFISLKGICNVDTDNDQCIPTLSVYKTAAHILEAVLAVMALLLVFLIFIIRKRESNVIAEPLSLAGTASLMQNQEFLNIIRELPSHGVKEKALLALLPPHSYKIGHYQNADGTWGYGLMLSRDISSPNTPYNNSNSYANINLHHNNDVDSIEEKSVNTWNRFSRLIQVLGFALMLIGLLALIVYYLFFKTDYKTGFGKFMSSQQFGVKFLFTSLGVIIAQFWAYAREGTSPSLSKLLPPTFHRKTRQN